jgi:predicted NACHT family NTPase
MSRESLNGCPDGINKAKIALTDKGWSHEELADKVETTRQPVANFFAGKGVDRKNFVKICEQLGLNWQEIAGQTNLPNLVSLPGEANINIDIDVLVKEVREKIKLYIQERCGTMRVLDMTQPIGLGDIYTDVNILEKITGRRRVDIAELQQNFKIELGNFDRFGLGNITQKRIPGLEAVERHSKLMVLGKPGAGKTTFLKYLASQCINRNFQANRIPIFITLKQFAETVNNPNLQEFIIQQFVHDVMTEQQIVQLVNSGRFLLLLDGLDEVREEDSSEVINHIKDFSERYHTNQFVITCRIAAREYIFEKFTEVEVADFDRQQITTFVTKWFQNKELNLLERFIQQLEFNYRIKELATNPLLLTLLCLEFEDSGDFPSDRAELYNRAIHTLLRKWDSKRGIVRDEVYKNLSIRYKEDLLSEIAWTTFKGSDYFFKQRDIEEYIQGYIRNLPQAKTDPDALRVDSEAVLKSIEAQHGLLVERARGIYSFSHLTFHEYFTAREIVYSSNQETLLKILASHMSETRWREVLLLTLGMLKSADNLLQLMKRQVDGLLATDSKLQDFLVWINKKSLSVDVSYKQTAIRTFYFGLVSGIDLVRNYTFNKGIVRELNNDIYRGEIDSSVLFLDRAFIGALELIFPSYQDIDNMRTMSNHYNYFLDFVRGNINALNSEPELKKLLQKLKPKLPNPEQNWEIFKQWCKAQGPAWAEQFRTAMINYRDIGHDWQFSESQRKLLNQYFDANKLLVDCLKSDCYVSREVRQEIKDTLLLPVS